MNKKIQIAIHQLYDLCTCLNNLSQKMIDKDVIDFLSYLSALDGVITDEEARFINENFEGNDFSAETLRDYIVVNNTFSTHFENLIPESLICLVKNDYFLKEKEVADSFLFVKSYELIGREFISCDGDANQDEVELLSRYVGMLNEYVLDNIGMPKDICATKEGIEIKESESGLIEPPIDSLLEELNSLIGLDSVKQEVNSLIHLQQINKMRLSRGLKGMPVSNHLVFYGNPGTGKTTVARILAKIYHSMGILSKGQLIEVDRSGLVAGYIGQTAIKTQEVINSAIGGILFIDEAYSLTYSNSQNDYGQEAIDVLIKAMEDNRDDFIVIVAGYPRLMESFINSNPGLRSRFNKYIYFEDYSEDDMLAIFKLMCSKSGFAPTSEALSYAYAIFEQMIKNKTDSFANAREVRNFFEKAIANQADRLFSESNLSNEQLTSLEVSDLMSIV